MTLLALAVSGRGLVAADEPAVFADDEAFLRGRAAFETVRIYGGRPFHLDAHLERLAESARRLMLPPADLAGLAILIDQALEAAAAGEAVLRFYWTPGREGQKRPLAFVLVRDLPQDLEELRGRGIRLVSVPVGLDGPGLLGGVKSTSYALNMVAVDEARRRGVDDAVLVGAGGIVLEGSTFNLWWRRGRTLYTPGLELGILAGVTRDVMLGLAPKLSYEVQEGVFDLADVAGSEEVFATSSVREVMPVVAVDDATFPVGTAAAALLAALRVEAQLA